MKGEIELKIKRLSVSNFKSINKSDVALGDFNVIVGPNASGKSNFLSVFRFLRDVGEMGLRNAISVQGGPSYFRNLRLGDKKNFELSIELTGEHVRRQILGEQKKFLRPMDIRYEFALDSHTNMRFKVLKDQLTESYTVYQEVMGQNPRPAGKGKFVLEAHKGRIKRISHSSNEKISSLKDNILPEVIFRPDVGGFPHGLLVEQPVLSLCVPPFLERIGVYDIDPKLGHKPSQVTGRADLEENGSNLPIVLRDILENRESRRKLLNLVRDLLPFVEGMEVKRFIDRSLMLGVRERYSQRQSLPASLLSDGTINIAAIIVALYFEGKSVIAIEEPEQNIHPYLISKLVNMMRDVTSSGRTQVLLSTHSPEIIRHCKVSELLFISRNEGGFSEVSKPADKAEVQKFLKAKMGLEDLFINSLL